MDDQRLCCERTDKTVTMIAAVQGAETRNDDLPAVVHRDLTRDQILASKLLTALSELIETMAEGLTKDRETMRARARQASAVLLSCVRDANTVDTALAEPNERRVYRGGLAPWQVRGVTTYISANLNTSLSCEMLARLVNLSVSHFARAFKCTFGCSPHVFLMRRRVERAQGLMLKTNVPLAQIAFECGFADQAHLSRLFLQFTGESPASWRRARANGTEMVTAQPGKGTGALYI